jgi:hypothetical protein
VKRLLLYLEAPVFTEVTGKEEEEAEEDSSCCEQSSSTQVWQTNKK